MENNIIGGEIESNILLSSTFNQIHNRNHFFSSGRSALKGILSTIKIKGIKRILIPEYLCASIIDTILSTNLQIETYELDHQFLPLIPLIIPKINKHVAILIINYFGLQNIQSSIEELKKYSDVLIIEDNVQAFYNHLNFDNSLSDYSFTSIRKWFGLPDGGMAISKYSDLPFINTTNSYWRYKYAGLILKSNKKYQNKSENIYLSLLKRGEIKIETEISNGCSLYSKTTIWNLDFNKIAQRRIANSKIILSGLQELKIRPLININKDSVPFFIPIYIEKRDKLRELLYSNKIFCPVHWPIKHSFSELAMEMANHELSIIIDQRYNKKDMYRFLSIISKFVK